jgi:hypothetical protein
MKIRRSSSAFLAIVAAVAAVLAFVYALPSGRHVRRETLRAFRLARNATGVYPLPLLTITMWRGTERAAVLVEVYESGRLVASRSGERSERQLTRDDSARIVETGMLALGDFSSVGCDTERGGLNAQLYLLRDGAWMGSICRDASNWPGGLETKRLFTEIESHVPGVFAGL